MKWHSLLRSLHKQMQIFNIFLNDFRLCLSWTCCIEIIYIFLPAWKLHNARPCFDSEKYSRIHTVVVKKKIQLSSALVYLLNRGQRSPQQLWCSCRICCSRRFLQLSAAAASRPDRRVSPIPRHLTALLKPTKEHRHIFITLRPDSTDRNNRHVA